MPEPSPPLPPAVTRTETTLGSTAAATAFQSGAGAPLVTRGAELAAVALVPVVVDEADDEPSRSPTSPTVSRLDSRAAPTPTAATPVQPGPRRWVRCGGAG